MARKKRQLVIKDSAPKEEIKEPVVLNVVDPLAEKPDEKPTEKPVEKPVEKVKAPKEPTEIDKWNGIVKLLTQKFPIFQPGELDIVNCTIEDRKVHIRARLSMTDKEIADAIPGY